MSLGRFFVAKQPLIDLMCVAAVAQEPLLLVGPPGTAKSDLVIKFKDALKIPDGEYFEYLLTRFTEPSEVFGPIDIAELRSGRYLRRSNGKLPTARLVFLDEIFKANSAILNSLLTVINERKFYQDGQPVPVKLRILLAATNELPENVELAALKDRFCLKAACRSVQDEHFVELIDAGLEAYTHRELNQKPWIEGHASLEDFVKAHRYLTHVLARRTNGPDGNPAARPRPVLLRRAAARAAPRIEDARARRRRVRLRSQGRQALPPAPHPRVDHARRRGRALGPAPARVPRRDPRRDRPARGESPGCSACRESHRSASCARKPTSRAGSRPGSRCVASRQPTTTSS